MNLYKGTKFHFPLQYSKSGTNSEKLVSGLEVTFSPNKNKTLPTQSNSSHLSKLTQNPSSPFPCSFHSACESSLMLPFFLQLLWHVKWACAYADTLLRGKTNANEWDDLSFWTFKSDHTARHRPQKGKEWLWTTFSLPWPLWCLGVALHIPHNSLKTKKPIVDVAKSITSGFPSDTGVKANLHEEVSVVLLCLISSDLIPWQSSLCPLQRQTSMQRRKGTSTYAGFFPSNLWREVLSLPFHRKADTLQLILGVGELRSDTIREFWLRQTLLFPKG